MRRIFVRFTMVFFIIVFSSSLVISQDTTERYMIKFKEHIFEEKSSVENQYSLHDLKSSKFIEFTTLMNEPEFMGLVFEKIIPEAIPGDVIRIGRRTGKTVIVPDLSLWYFVDLNKIQRELLAQVITSRFENFIVTLEKWVEPRVLSQFPNDPMYHEIRSDQVDFVQWELRRVEAEQAWQITSVNSDLKVGVIDYWLINVTANPNYPPWTGEQVQIPHPDLSNGVLYNSTGYYGGHGAYVAGIIGAITDNNQYLASLGHGVSMYGYNYKQASDYYRSINNDFVDVINMSLSTTSSSFMQEFTESALLQEIVVVAGAGNGAGDNPCRIVEGPFPCIGYPAAHYFPDIEDGTKVIAVSATDIHDQFVEGWNYSPGTDPISNPTTGFVDISAPGKDMRVLWSNWDIGAGKISHWISDHPTGGTSFSTPLVTAAVTLILSINDSLIPKQIYEILTSSTEKVGQYSYDYSVDARGWNQRMGYGRLNAYKALKYTIENYGATVGGIAETVTFPENFTVKSGNTLRILSGTEFISKGNLTIQAGAELIIEPGVTIKLDPGKSIIANGALTAIGTQSDPIRVERNGSSAWKRISVNGNSDIRWAVIDGGQTGLEVSGSDNQIRNSTVENNWYGIWMNNVSETTLSNTMIRDNLYEGLLLYGSNDLDNSIHENTITNNGNAGFYLFNSELADFHKNVIENTSGNGISIMGSSHLFFQENIGAPNDAGLNRVKNNSGHQIYISHSSRAFLGNSYFSGTDAGHNSVYHSNSSYANKYIYNLAVTGPGYSGTSFSILAQFTYWNTYPSSGMFHGAVNYNNHLSSDPTSGSGVPAGQIPLMMSPDYTEISLPAVLTSSISEHIASQYENQTEADNAIGIKNRMIELRARLAQNPYAKENAIYLNELYTLSLLDRGNRLVERSNVEKTLGDWTGKRFYLQSDFRGDNNVSLAVETAMLIAIREALKAEDTALAVEYIADYSPYIRNTDHRMALAKNMIAVDLNRGGYQAGLDKLNELYRIEPDRDVEKWFSAPDLSSIEFLLNDLMNSNGKGEPSLYRFASVMDMASNEQQPVSFALGHNYPNPFNPSTVIPFSIPVQSNVSIEIYDMLGRIVTRLSNATYETGLHEVSWDASQMASGVYLVRAVIDPLDNQGRQQHFTRAITLLK